MEQSIGLMYLAIFLGNTLLQKYGLSLVGFPLFMGISQENIKCIKPILCVIEMCCFASLPAYRHYAFSYFSWVVMGVFPKIFPLCIRPILKLFFDWYRSGWVYTVFCVGSVIGGFLSFENFFRPFCGQNLGKNGKFLRKLWPFQSFGPFSTQNTVIFCIRLEVSLKPTFVIVC